MKVDKVYRWSAAEFGYIDKVISRQLTHKNITKYDKTGRAPIHYIAENGMFHHIPDNLLNSKTLLLPTADEHMTTPLHIAAQICQLHLLPKAVLTKDNLTKKNSSGDTPLHYAAYSGQLYATSAHLTTETMLTKNQLGQTVLHYAAQGSLITAIPKKFLTEANLTIGDNNGVTPLHLACALSLMQDIPNNVWTETSLTVKSTSGIAPIHWIVIKGWLHKIPKNVLTEPVMFTPYESECSSSSSSTQRLPRAAEQTALHLAKEHRQLNSLLGIEFSERIIPIVGEEWYNHNMSILTQLRQDGGVVSKVRPQSREIVELEI